MENSLLGLDEKNLVYLSETMMWERNTSVLYNNQKAVALSTAETLLLECFINNINRKISSIDLYDYIWNDFKEYNPKSIRNLVCKIRKKLPKESIVNIYGSEYMMRSYIKHNCINPQLFAEIDILSMIDFPNLLDQLVYGVIITDPNQFDNPLVYANRYFYDLFGYEKYEVLGKNCRFLQGEDVNQPATKEIHAAIIAKKPITTIVKNYTKKGELIYNELTISPIFEKTTGKLQYFLGIHKQVV